jgi:hypothetical protein
MARKTKVPHRPEGRFGTFVGALRGGSQLPCVVTARKRSSSQIIPRGICDAAPPCGRLRIRKNLCKTPIYLVDRCENFLDWSEEDDSLCLAT